MLPRHDSLATRQRAHAGTLTRNAAVMENFKLISFKECMLQSDTHLMIVAIIRWRVHMNIIKSYIFAFSISLLLYSTKSTGFSYTIARSVPVYSHIISEHSGAPCVLPKNNICLWCTLINVVMCSKNYDEV